MGIDAHQAQQSHSTPLNVDHHASAFHRVGGIGSGNGQQSVALDSNAAVFASPNPSMLHQNHIQPQQIHQINNIGPPAPSTPAPGQHHQLLLALIQQQLKGAASGGSTSASAQIAPSDSNNNINQQNCGQNYCGGRIPATGNISLLNILQQQRMNAPMQGAGKGAQNEGQQSGNEQQNPPMSALEAKNEPIQVPMDQSDSANQMQIGQKGLGGQKMGASNANLGIAAESPCGGCRELKREVEELRQMLFQMQQESAGPISTSVHRRQPPPPPPQALLKPQSPPSPPHPSFPNQQIPLPNTPHSAQNQQHLRQTLLQQAAINQQQFAPASGNANNYNSHMLQMFLSQTNAQNVQQHPPAPISSSSSSTIGGGGVNRMLEMEAASANGRNNPQNAQWGGVMGAEKQQQQLLASTLQMLQQAAQMQQINANAPSHQQMGGSGTSTRNNSIQSGESVFFDPSGGMDVSETSSSASSTNTQMMLQSPPQLIDSKPATAASLLQQLQANSQQQFGQSNAAVQQNLTSNRAQLELINAAISRTNAAVASHLLSPAHGPAVPIAHQQQGNSQAIKLATLQTLLLSLQQQQQQQQQHQHHQFALQQRIQQQQAAAAAAAGAIAAANKNPQQKMVQPVGRISAQNHHFGGLSSAQFGHHQNSAQRHSHHEGGQPPQNERVVERRRAASDDYIQSICSQKYTDEYIQQIQIPVPEAQNCDPNFRPLTEQQVIQQVLQNKKYENQSIGETMAQLCKKLAEKRVFGSRLMSKTTVAAPNHSSYSNLPLPGIIYIYHVCQKVLLKKIGKEEEFKEYFRDAMRKLAARCRRVRHARKNHHHKHGAGTMELAPVTAAMLVSQPPFQQFAGRPTTTTTIGVAAGNAGGPFTGNEAAAATISAALAELAARQQQQNEREYSLQSSLAHLENPLTADLPPSSSSGPSLLAQIENGISQQSFLGPALANEGEGNNPQGIEQMEIGESHMGDEEEEEEEHLGQLSSPTISSQSTGASTAHQQSPGEGDGDTSEASDSAQNQALKEGEMKMKGGIGIEQQNSESGNQQMQMDTTAGF